jgi:hypothetical protein
MSVIPMIVILVIGIILSLFMMRVIFQAYSDQCGCAECYYAKCTYVVS